RMGADGALGALPPTPELLAQVRALPPANETPKVTEDPTAPDPGFRLRRLLQPVRAALIVVGALVVADALMAMGLPALFRHGIDSGVRTGQTGALFFAAGVGLVLVGLGWLDIALTTILTARVGERLLYVLRVKSYAHLQRLGLEYYEREMAGRILTRMTTYVEDQYKFL